MHTQKSHNNISRYPEIFGFPTFPWLLSKIKNTQPLSNNKPSIHGIVIYLGHKLSIDDTKNIIKKYVSDWQSELVLQNNKNEKHQCTNNTGFVWILHPKLKKINSIERFLTQSEYAKAQNLAGEVLKDVEKSKLSSLEILFYKASKNEILGFLCGLEIASYKFKQYWSNNTKSDITNNNLNFHDSNKTLENLILTIPDNIDYTTINKAAYQGCAVNLTRHLINLPASVLAPPTYAKAITKLFKNAKNIKVKILNEHNLQKEKMNLILAVGSGAQHPPCVIHLKYVPPHKKNNHKHALTFIGKGITFDTGGLNLKTSIHIRHMKKDMAGSAVLAGLAFWLEHSQITTPYPCNLFLALAENAISSKSLHPGDIIVSRNGISVEIDNTDAEGRLVMADVFDLAQDEKIYEKPLYLINIATLTGAMRMALGTELGGFFSNDDTLAQQIIEAGYESGDIMWRMPLFEAYEEYLKSSNADCINCSSKMGGAITAALFLKKFIKDPILKWAHFDIYAHKESPKGHYTEEGAWSQGLLCLINFLEKIK